MKTGESLKSIAEELERRKAASKDYVAPTTKLEMETEHAGHDAVAAVTLRVNGHGSFAVNKIAHDQIAGRVGIPRAYYDRMLKEEPELLATNVNRWFQRKPEPRLIRTLDGRARAFLSNKYRRIDDADIAEVTLSTLAKAGAMVESSALTDTRLYIKAVTPKVTAEIKKGDVVQAGIVISNSEVGMGAVKIEPLVYRLVCTNGLIVADHTMRSRHVGRYIGDGEEATELYTTETIEADDKALLMKIRDVVRKSFDAAAFSRIVDQMRLATKREIEKDVDDVIEVVQKRFALQENESQGVLKHLIKGGDLTQYGLVNAVTRFSQDVPDYDRATELERLGGDILELPARDWKALAAVA